MYFDSQDEQSRILLKLSLVALYILMAYGAVMFIAGYFIIRANIVHPSASLSLIKNILFLLAILEMVATYFVKISLLKRAKIKEMDSDGRSEKLKYSMLLQMTIVIAAMCSAISTYGLVLVLLGEDIELLVLFVALSLIGYQFFRLRPRDFGD